MSVMTCYGGSLPANHIPGEATGVRVMLVRVRVGNIIVPAGL